MRYRAAVAFTDFSMAMAHCSTWARASTFTAGSRNTSMRAASPVGTNGSCRRLRVSTVSSQPAIGALLIENAAIKSEVPLFNRRQRQLRRLWTIQLQSGTDGFLKPVSIDFAPTGSRDIDTYGLFANKHRITTTIQNLARDHALCLRVMGLDKGKGACFQHQLGRCDGACAGQENPDAHNARLLDQLDRQRIAAWPFEGPLLLAEQTIHPLEHQPAQQFHLVDQWAWHGCFDSQGDAKSALSSPTATAFDRDAYRLIYSAIYRGRVALQDALTQRPLVNPLLAQRQAAS